MALKHGTGPWNCMRCGNQLGKSEQEGDICGRCAGIENEQALRTGTRLEEIRAAFAKYAIPPLSEKGSDTQLSQGAATLDVEKEVIKMGNRGDQPFHCGPRMEFVPGYAKDRYTCKNCGAIAVRNRAGFTIYQNQEHMDKVLKARSLPPSPLSSYFDQRDLDWKKDESEGN